MQQLAQVCSNVAKFPAAFKGYQTGPHELRIPMWAFGPTLSLVISKGSALNSPSIYAWLQADDIGPHGPLATFEACLDVCTVERDDFGGDPVLHIGGATFRVPEPYAAAVEARFGFVSVGCYG